VKKLLFTKSKEVKTKSNLAEYSKEGYGSNSAVLPVIIMWIFWEGKKR
jgi:hypothetical protein